MKYLEVPPAGGKKRKRNQPHEKNGFDGVSQFTATSSNDQSAAAPRETKSRERDEGWEHIGKNGKKQKNNYPELRYSDLHRLHRMIKVHDLQGLMLYCLADAPAPEYISVKHHRDICKAVVLLVPGLEKALFDEGLSLSNPADVLCGGERDSHAEMSLPTHVKNNYHANRFQHKKPQHPDDYLPSKLRASPLPAPLKPLSDIFLHLWPVEAPGDDRMRQVHSPLHAMLQCPIPKTRHEKHAEKFKKGPQSVAGPSHGQDKPTKISEFVHDPAELVRDEYVIHPTCWISAGLDLETEQMRRTSAKQSLEDGWKDTDVAGSEQILQNATETAGKQFEYADGRQVLALDCEMCTVQGGASALTRISILDWNGDKIVDELVKPDLEIIDYLTPYSGITASMLADVTTSLAMVQDKVLSLITPSAILLGHSLQSDLQALKITHPHIVDTALLYPHPRGPPMKSSLKYLTQKYLNREIQKGHGATGHDSIEDARAVLDLVKLKCQKGPEWGTSNANNEPVFRRLKRSDPSGDGSRNKQGCIIDWGDPGLSYGKMADFAIGCKNDDEVVKAVQRAVNGDDDGLYIPGGGVALTWARMRALEEARGWRNDLHDPSPRATTADASGENSNNASNDAISMPTLSTALTSLTSHIQAIHASLPPCTLLIIYSGTGDPRPMRDMQARRRHFENEFKHKGRKWDELAEEERWTDREEQELARAVRRAREGVGLMCVK